MDKVNLTSSFNPNWVGIVDEFLKTQNRMYVPGTTKAQITRDYMRYAVQVDTISRFAVPDGTGLRMKTKWTIDVSDIYRMGMESDEDSLVQLGADASAGAMHRDFPVKIYLYHRDYYLGHKSVWDWIGISNVEMWDWLKKGIYPPSWVPDSKLTGGTARSGDLYTVDPKTGFVLPKGLQ